MSDDNDTNWDLDRVVSEKDQQEIALAVSRSEFCKLKLCCRLGWHRWSDWQSVSMMQMKAVNANSGQEETRMFEISMRVCFACGRPDPRMRQVG